jgi:hypothetical protein
MKPRNELPQKGTRIDRADAHVRAAIAAREMLAGATDSLRLFVANPASIHVS